MKTRVSYKLPGSCGAGTLPAGSRLISTHVGDPNTNVGKSARATLWTAFYNTVALSALLLLLANGIFAQWDDSLLKPFMMDHRDGGGPSPADVAFLLDAPAGKDGFIRIQNGHLVKP